MYVKVLHSNDEGIVCLCGAKVELERHDGNVDGPRREFSLNCGTGEQILRWIGSASCGRLAIEQGDVVGKFVPQAVLNEDGKVMDPDTILSEAFQDGSSIKVTYSDGPVAFTERWEGRPRTPPFKWGIHGEELPPFDAWLTEKDLTTEPLITSLLPTLLQMETSEERAYDVAGDCEMLHRVLIQNAGTIQAAFSYVHCSGHKQWDALGQLSLTQFRAFTQSIAPEFPVERVDEIFIKTALCPSSLERKNDSQNSCYLDLEDFLLALVQLSAEWNSDFSNTDSDWGNQTSITQRFSAFWSDCGSKGMLHDISVKTERLLNAYTPQLIEILNKNRRLTKQTLENCQMKRIRSSEIQVELRHLCIHFHRWGLLGREFSLQDLALMTIAAKQRTSKIGSFVLHPEPTSLNFDEFERLLFGVSYHMCLMQKKREQFGTFLTETLDEIYKKAGVLVEIQKL